MTDPVEIAVLGDLHGMFDAELDVPLLARHPVRLCTGDLTPNRGRDRFDEALRQARGLAQAGALVILGNHDGPTAFTGRAFPRSYHQLETILGDLHVGGRIAEFPDLGLSVVGARPLSSGGDDLRFAPPGREDWSIARWAEEITTLIATARGPRIVILAHAGASGLGATRDAIFGCDFRDEQGDWGDSDLRLALDRSVEAGRPVVAVIAGHMHDRLRGGGRRTLSLREGGVLHVNAAIVPRVGPRGRAMVVVRLEGMTATARVEWHAPDGSVAVEPLA